MLKIENTNNTTLGNSNIVKDEKVIFSITKNYDDLSDEDKIKVLDFTMEKLQKERYKTKNNTIRIEFESKFNLEQEIINSRKEVFRYLEGGKFKKLDYLVGFIQTYYYVHYNYELQGSVLDIIVDRIKSECCEEE